MVTGDRHADGGDLFGGAGIGPDFAVGVDAAEAVGGVLLGGAIVFDGIEIVGLNFSRLEFFDKAKQLTDVGVPECHGLRLTGRGEGFEPCVEDDSLGVDGLNGLDNGGEFALPGGDDREHVLQQRGREGRIWGVAVMGDGDAFGFGKVEILES